MPRPALAASIAAAALLLATAPATGLAQIDSTHLRPPGWGRALPTISASGSGEVKVAPDRATVRIAVQTEQPTATAAAAENATRTTAVMNALHRLGIPDNRLSTAEFEVAPRYRYGQGQPPQLVGYTVTNSVVAELHDLRQVGQVLDAAMGAGANLVSSLSFYLSNSDQPRRQALTEAVARARGDAESAARAAGGALGPLVSMHVSGYGTPTPPPRPMMLARAEAGMAATTPITPGQSTVSAHVTATWQFLPPR